ncbi:uncharacterized protein H6S33_011035 [Morchella sextelata]|uniref:uncharacterized protein n=1 Tax=Morchella sextelata TaxID=1174677 RepID=UPI001D053BF5|nr:uncharacterized protein H6S33_011035 [Morchella sextelata]KAH0611770.1 hypothetical protein H6S33_011035 [Morchella sextelata]
MPSLDSSTMETINRASLDLLCIQKHHLEFIMRNLTKNHQSRYRDFLPNRRAYMNALATAPEKRALPQEACLNRWEKAYKEEGLFHKMIQDVEKALKTAKGRIASMTPNPEPSGGSRRVLHTTPWAVSCSSSAGLEPTLGNIRFLMNTCLLMTKACDGKESDMDVQRKYISAIMTTGANKRNQTITDCVVGATKCLSYLYKLEVRGREAERGISFLDPEFGKEDTKRGTITHAMERRRKRMRAIEEKWLKNGSGF